MRIVVASTNPVKLGAVEAGFSRMFPDVAVAVEAARVSSGIGNQPLSEGETLRGATARAENAARAVREADFWVGIEGGVAELDGEMGTFAWIVVKSRTLVGRSRTGTFFLPDVVARRVRGGMELGRANDAVFGRTDSKKKEGAIGILTENLLDRRTLYEHGVLLALVPFRNIDLYSEAPSASEQADSRA